MNDDTTMRERIEIEEQEMLSDEDYEDDDVIITAIRAIVRATDTPDAAKATLEYLEKELKRSLQYDTSEDSLLEYPLSDMEDDGDVDIERTLKEGTHKISSTKKTESDKWKDLLVYFLDNHH